MAKVTLPLFEGWTTSASFWVTQGPTSGIEAHTHGGEVHDHGPESDAPALGYGANFEDNNSDKMVGFRLRGVSAGGLTLQVSGYRGAYDEDSELVVSGVNVAMVLTPGSLSRPLFDLRAEGVLIDQEYLDVSEERSVQYGGYYVQLSRRWNGFEPVVRWSHLLSEFAGPARVVPRRRQTAVGLNYWLSPSIPVKAAYNFEPDATDSFAIEWTVGF